MGTRDPNNVFSCVFKTTLLKRPKLFDNYKCQKPRGAPGRPKRAILSLGLGLFWSWTAPGRFSHTHTQVYVCMRTDAKRWVCMCVCVYAHGGKMMGVYVCMVFRSPVPKPVWTNFRSSGGSSGRPETEDFGFSFEQFLGLGRPWAVWRPQTTCFYLLLAPERPKPCIFTCFLVPGDPKSRVFICLWPPGARNHLFYLFLAP